MLSLGGGGSSIHLAACASIQRSAFSKSSVARSGQ
jgi:hypothetical protein